MKALSTQDFDPGTIQRRKIFVWKDFWLAGSETFVRNQVGSIRAFETSCIGMGRIATPLSKPDDTIFYNSSSLAKYASKLARITGFNPAASRLLRQEKPDVVYAYFATDAMSIRREAKRQGIPLVCAVLGVDVSQLPDRSGIKGAFFRRNLKKLFRDSALVLPISEALRDKCIQFGAEASRTRTHSIGVLVPEDAPDRRKVYDFCFVGRFVEKKGIDDFLSALALLPNGTQVRVAIVGDGPMRPKIELLLRSLTVHVELLGFLAPTETQEVVEMSRWLIVPSKTSQSGDMEGLPTVALEAQARGVPIIGTTHSGIPDAVVHGVTGYLSPEGDVEGLAENLRLALDNPSRSAEMGISARKFVGDNFSVLAQTAHLEKMLFEVLGSGTGSTKS